MHQLVYESAHDQKARQALKLHYFRTVNMYRFLAGFGSFWRAVLFGWERSGHPAMCHFGWDAERLPIDESMREGVRESGRLLNLPSDRPTTILEVGCGLGGNIIQFARDLPWCLAIGITIVPEQAIIAESIRRARGVSNARFCGGNMLTLPFPDNSLDGIVAFESFSHIPWQEKPAALKEFRRVLKPGARLVMVDGYLAPNRPAGREADYSAVLRGLTLPHLITADEQARLITSAGLNMWTRLDCTRRIKYFAAWLSRQSMRWYPLVLAGYALRRFRFVQALLHRFGMTSELSKDMARAGMALWRLIRDGFCTYEVHIACKPSAPYRGDLVQLA